MKMQPFQTRARAVLTVGLAVAATATATQAASTYTSRAIYNGVAGPATATENFSGFAADTSFRTVPVNANGFSLQQVGSAGTFRNEVDVVPLVFPDNNGTANASTFVNAAEGTAPATDVVITLAAPAKGFGADFYGVEGNANAVEGLVALVFNGGTQIASFNFADLAGEATLQFFGVVAGAGEQITSIRLTSRLLIAGSAGEGFGLDDATVTAIPEPTTLAALAGVAAVSRRRRRAR